MFAFFKVVLAAAKSVLVKVVTKVGSWLTTAGKVAVEVGQKMVSYSKAVKPIVKKISEWFTEIEVLLQEMEADLAEIKRTQPVQRKSEKKNNVKKAHTMELV